MVVGRKTITVSEFEKFLAAPENRERLFELVNGEIVEKVVTQKHGIIAAFFATELNLYLRQNKIGRVGVEVRHQAAGDAENDRLPDVSFTRDLDKPVTEVGAVPYMPDLAIEIKSPDDTIKGMREKARYYLAHGSRLVWLVFPEKRIVEVYSPTEEQVLTENDTLTGGEVLPGFSLAVRSIFEA
jgi:Uma2 family endonuclease